MSAHNLRIQALIFVQMAMIEAMKAENAFAASVGRGLPYGEAPFIRAAEEIQRLADSYESE